MFLVRLFGQSRNLDPEQPAVKIFLLARPQLVLSSHVKVNLLGGKEGFPPMVTAGHVAWAELRPAGTVTDRCAFAPME